MSLCVCVFIVSQSQLGPTYGWLVLDWCWGNIVMYDKSLPAPVHWTCSEWDCIQVRETRGQKGDRNTHVSVSLGSWDSVLRYYEIFPILLLGIPSRWHLAGDTQLALWHMQQWSLQSFWSPTGKTRCDAKTMSHIKTNWKHLLCQTVLGL